MDPIKEQTKILPDNEEVVKILSSFPELNNGALGLYEITALQVFAAFTKKGITRSIKQLVLHENIINQGDQLGRTPLHYAALNGNTELLEFLLERGANPACKFKYRETSLRTSHENYNKWNKLYTMLPPPDGWGRTPLHLVAKEGHADALRILIEHKANVNEEDEKGVTPLLLAGCNKSKESYESIVDVLLDTGARVDLINNVTGTTALFHAVALKSTKATESLLKAGAWLREGPCYQTELHEAASKGLIEILQKFLDDTRISLGDINKPDACNRTPVYRAAYAGHKDCLKLLIERGGDLGHVTKTNETVMDAIFAHITKPAVFVRELLDERIIADDANDNNENFRITLDFNILAPYGNDKQMAVISNILVAATERQKIEVFQHPLIETYLRLKWAKIRLFFFLLIYSYLFFVLSLSAYVILHIHHYKCVDAGKTAARSFVIIFAGGLMAHALIQCILVPRNFFRQYEMWMNLTCTTLSLIVALVGNEELNETGNKKSNWVLHTTSVAVLLAWTELMLLIGRFPTYGYYALMFAAVLQNVVKVLLTFVCLVIGFALSFSIQFHSYEQFTDPWRALVKTTVMMMGEFEYADLFTDNNEAPRRLPATSRVIFLLFIILASIVLMNLMVGLAVSDIQGLQEEGHVRRLEKQAEFLRQLEKVISFKAIESKWFPGIVSKILKRKRSIATTIVIYPECTGSRKNKYDKNLPPELIESIVTVAHRHREKEDEYSSYAKDFGAFIEKLRHIIQSYERIQLKSFK